MRMWMYTRKIISLFLIACLLNISTVTASAAVDNPRDIDLSSITAVLDNASYVENIEAGI